MKKMVKFEKYGSWWDLSPLEKCVRWLRYVPLSYIKAVIFVIPAWRANKSDLSLKIAFILLVSLGTERLGKYYILKEDANP
uniref:Uncharacterized protein n=1 Tax=viral metagenome TaxID=1070528 RepID=A0A6M3L1T4_9ZZZZ